MTDNPETKSQSDLSKSLLKISTSEDDTPPEKKAKTTESSKIIDSDNDLPPPLQPISSSANNLLQNITNLIQSKNANSQLGNVLTASINNNNSNNNNNSIDSELALTHLLNKSSPDPTIASANLPRLQSTPTSTPIPNQPDISSTHYYNHDNILVVSLNSYTIM